MSGGQSRSFHPAYRRRLFLARAALGWERFWPAALPALGVAGLFAIGALLEVWTLLPGLAHLAVLLLFAAAFCAAAFIGGRGFRWPGIEEARRRIELKSGFSHRPLFALDDRLLAGAKDAAASALWLEHQRRLRAALTRLTVGLPSPGMAARDPWAARFALALLLVVGFAAALDDAPRRMLAALKPDFSGAFGRPPTLDAWLSPPTYTGLPPIFLTREDGPISSEKPFRVPVGSTLLARVQGGRGEAKMSLGAEVLTFSAIDAQNQQLSREIREGGKLSIAQGRSQLAAWPLEIVPDQLPQIGFAEEPSGTPRAALKIGYNASDDYGIARVGLEIRREGSAEVFTLGLTLPGLNPKTATETSFHDLAPHPWAGLEVTATLFAEDAAGQRGSSEPVSFKLPEREFNHPVARAIIEQRRHLLLRPERRALVALALNAIADLPDEYNNDATVRLALRSAEIRTVNSASPETVNEVQQLLWETALKVEDGSLSLAERDLRDAQKALQEALARNAPEAEIERLMQQLQAALDKFLQAMIEQALREGRVEDEDPESLRQDQELSRDDLQKMLDRAMELSRQGSRDAARDMLSQLQNMIENLKNGRIVRRQGPRNSERGMQELSDLMREQQQLLDRSFRRSQQGPGQRGQQGQQQGQQGQRGQRQPGQGGQEGGEDDPSAMGQSQEQLRRRLGELMRRLGEGGMEVPQGFGNAERSMRDARDALNQGQPGVAVGPQTNALDQLREGAQSMMQQMMGNQDGEGPGRGNQPNRPAQARNNREDPLGRPMPGDWDSGDSTKVPSQADQQRAREILEELYRRSGERSRPEMELQYLERLLKRF